MLNTNLGATRLLDRISTQVSLLLSAKDSNRQRREKINSISIPFHAVFSPRPKLRDELLSKFELQVNTVLIWLRKFELPSEMKAG